MAEKAVGRPQWSQGRMTTHQKQLRPYSLPAAAELATAIEAVGGARIAKATETTVRQPGGGSAPIGLLGLTS